MSSSAAHAGPVGTFRADVEGSGECHIPDAFGERFRVLAASLDWARVFQAQGRSIEDRARNSSAELRAAQTAAIELARIAQTFADRADMLAGSSDDVETIVSRRARLQHAASAPMQIAGVDIGPLSL